MESYSDEELVAEYIANKNSVAFSCIYDRYVSMVYRFIYSRVGNRSWAEDLTSETFMSLLEVLPAFRQDSTLKSFIFGIAVNKIRQFWNFKRIKGMDVLDQELSEEYYVFDEDVSEEEVENLEVNQAINSILKELPDNYSKVLKLRFLESASVKLSAQKLGISEENVRIIQHRAIKKARELLSNVKV